MVPGLRERAWLRCTLVLLVVLAALSPSLTADFAWDDRRFVVDSPVIGDLAAVPGYFVRNMQESYGQSGEAAASLDLYRPVPFALLAVQHRLAGGARPALFHATSLLLHLLVVLLLWLLARRWLGEGWKPEACALLFGLHPVAAGAALWVSAQTELLMAASLLGALLLLDPSSDRPKAAAAVFAVGLLSKEVLLLALPAVSVALVARGLPRRRLVPIWTVAGLFVLVRTAVLGGLRGGEGSALGQAALQAPILLLDGLRGLALGRPTGLRHLSFEYELLSPGAALGLGLAGLSILAGLALLGWRLRRRAPQLLLAVAVFVCLLAPVAVVTTVPGWGGYGRYLYVPWLFGALAVVQAAGPRAWPVVAGLLLVVQASALPQALGDWRSDDALGASQVRNRPDLGVGHGWLGQVDFDRGDWAAAAQHYRAAIEVDPSYHPPFQNLALCEIRLGQAGTALGTLDRLEALHGVGPRSSFARGLALAQLGDYEGAARVAVAALRQAPGHEDLQWLLDNLRAHHPDPAAFEAFVEGLSASGPAAPPGSGSGTSAPAPRSTGSP